MKRSTEGYVKKVLWRKLSNEHQGLSQEKKKKVVNDVYRRMFWVGYQREIDGDLKGPIKELCQILIDWMGISWGNEEKLLIWKEKVEDGGEKEIGFRAWIGANLQKGWAFYHKMLQYAEEQKEEGEIMEAKWMKQPVVRFFFFETYLFFFFLFHFFFFFFFFFNLFLKIVNLFIYKTNLVFLSLGAT